jgi:Tol biopolymer transport system component/predicted Ser/Thr protein kinase
MPAPLSIGQRLQSYLILEKLGRGGMGEVYLAEDLRLGRRVALKVLPEEMTSDPAVVRRFRQEARAAAALSHPNVAHLYSVEEFEGRPFITMEYVTGRPLRVLIPASGMEIARFLTLALPLTSGFAAAHARGIVHRDIKPENILVTEAMEPKILDFGLARIAVSEDAETLLSSALTVEGTIMGTAAYMSPEQAEGLPVDARSDVFSLGVVFYEMLAGERPFRGETTVALLSSILRDEPQRLETIRRDLPPDVCVAIMKCLEKAPSQRLQSMQELQRDLAESRSRPSSGAAPSVTARPRRRLRAAAGAFAVLALFAAGLWLARNESPSQRARARAWPFDEARVARVTTLPGVEDYASWSPDGRSLLCATDELGRPGIWSLDPRTGARQHIGSPDADEIQAVFSPDGRRIAFVSSRDRGGELGIFMGSRAVELYVYGQNGDLYVMNADGSDATRILENAYDPSWSPVSDALACRSIRDGTWRVWIVPLDGSAPRAIAGESLTQRMLHPAWSPDGRWIAYVGSESAASGWDLFVVAASGGVPIRLTHDQATVTLEPAWTPDGRWIVFSSNRQGPVNLWRIAFDDDVGNAGEPIRVTTGIGEDVNPAFSPDGARLVYSTLRTAPDIWRLTLATDALDRLTSETTTEDYPRVSPDGAKLLFYSDRSGREEVWMLTLATGDIEPVSDGGGSQNAWSPDGATIAYGTPDGLVLVDAGTRERRTIAKGLAVEYPYFSPDSKWIAFQGHSDEGYRLYKATLPDGVPEPIQTPHGVPGNPSWAPDGRTIVFQLDQLGYRNIWALDTERGLTRQLTSGNIDDAHPDVSPDGKTVLFLRRHRELFVVPRDGGEPRSVYALPSRGELIEWPAWTPDGEGIVFSVSERAGDLFELDATGAP